MVRHWATSCLLLLSGAFCAFALDAARLQVSSKTISGVFMVTQNNKYSFNASVAIEVCETLHGNIATKAQVETALQNGLEMCRYGWVEEKIAVVPRIQANPKCGQNKTGLVLWRPVESKLLDVFCFSDTGTATTQRAMATSVTTKRQEVSTSARYPVTPPPLITSALTSLLGPLRTSTISHHDLSSSTSPPLSKKAPAEHLPRSTSSSQVTDTTLHKTPVTTTTTRRTTTSTRSFPASTTTSTTSSSTSSTLSPPVQTAGLAPSHSENPNLGVAPVALLVTLGLLLILLVAVAVCYKKKGRSLPFHRPEQEKGAVETEMFKHFRERDLKRHPSTGDGDRSRKCSSDITLLMEQETKAEIA
ncbi:lymphatic vessel endothelial hyaluronic receptor 1b [Sardina pilchardus]|uniref:lymphatic vessel endothelial hyaluronic receptor 1b n=1 Tax=Sardina pilchardus TaxID=27697 RepID=UPI002E0DA019